VHLNPVRVAKLGLDKRPRSAQRQGVGVGPGSELVAERLRVLREWRWSSYRAYAGYGAGPEWLWREPLGRVCGGRSASERRAALRQYHEEALRQGQMERPWDRLVAGLVLGTESFARRLRQEARGSARKQAQMRELAQRVEWPRIVSALEAAKGERWADFSGRYGDWGRDAALWLGRRLGRLRLGDLGRLAGGVDYAAVGQAVRRFGRRLERDRTARRMVAALESKLSHVTI